MKYFSFAGQKCEAVFSPCGHYRYWLAREWGVAGLFGVFFLYNPSSADALWLDPTTMRCNNLAVQWGWRGFGIMNLIPAITSDVDNANKMNIPEAINAENDIWLIRGRKFADVLVLAPGADGNSLLRSKINDLSISGPFHAISCNEDGTYKHPASIFNDEELNRFTAPKQIFLNI